MDLSAPPGIISPELPVPDIPESPPRPSPARTAISAATLESTSPVLQTRLAALAASPTPEAHLDVAAAYGAYGVHDRAFDYLATGLVLHPRHAGLHEAVARLWRDWGLSERGLRHAHLAVRYAPASPAAHTTLGTVLWALARRDAALAAFARAADLAPTATYARKNWCTALRELGRPRPFACDVPYADHLLPPDGRP